MENPKIPAGQNIRNDGSSSRISSQDEFFDLSPGSFIFSSPLWQLVLSFANQWQKKKNLVQNMYNQLLIFC